MHPAHPHRCPHARPAPSVPVLTGSGPVARLVYLWRWFWCIVARNRLTIAAASLIWLIWRSGPQPRRLAYPCQQAAGANLGALAILIVPAWARHREHHRGVARAATFATGSLALAGILFLAVSAGRTVYSQLTASFTPGNPAVVPWTPDVVTDPVAMSPRITRPNDVEAVVTVNRNTAPQLTYGVEPYNPGPNTAYNLIEDAVRELHLGPANNPLANLISDVDGDGVIEVVIKPNTVEYYNDQNGQRSPVYSHPATLRPLVDMAARAGAQRIYIGDGSRIGTDFYTKLNSMGYTESYFSTMRAAWPGVAIYRVNMADRQNWSWVKLSTASGGPSSYAGSGYVSANLKKANDNAAYFNQPDTHGRSGPGQGACMGALAITDYVLDADVIIDLAKLKVHYLGINTAVLKNWVGITMFSTADTTQQYWSRISHEKNLSTSYEQGFGNDIMWRELLDCHRAVLYWRDGVMHSTQQRRYLCVLDAINAAEKWHVFGPEDPQPYWLDTVLASVDPVAIDAVGSRLQRFDFRHIPIINNAHARSIGSTWPIGTADPARVRVRTVGTTRIDESYDHAFLFDRRQDASLPDYADTTLTDLTPPTIDAVGANDLGDGAYHVGASVRNATVVYLYYGDDGSGAPNVLRLGRDGPEVWSGDVDGPLGEAFIVAQDDNFNTSQATVSNLPVIALDRTSINAQTWIGGSPVPGGFLVWNIGQGLLTYTVTDDADWLWVDPVEGDSQGEQDTIAVNYSAAGLHAGTHEAFITVSGNAINSPKTIRVTLRVDTVKPDMDGDGDVDMSDFGTCQACITAPGVVSSAPCAISRIDADDDVDSIDCGLVKVCLSGANVPADPNCLGGP